MDLGSFRALSALTDDGVGCQGPTTIRFGWGATSRAPLQFEVGCATSESAAGQHRSTMVARFVPRMPLVNTTAKLCLCPD